MVVEVADEHIARAIHRDPKLGAQTDTDGGLTRSRGTAEGNLDHLIQVVIRDKEIACSIHCHTLRVVQSRAHGRHIARRCNLHDPMVVGVRDKEIARGVHS